MSTVEIIKGNCDCGAALVRELPAEHKAYPYYEMWRDAPFLCDECARRQEMEEARQKRESTLFLYLQRSGLPKARQVNLHELEHPVEVLDACRSWVQNGRGLMLTGDVGRGKTTLAGAAAFAMLKYRDVIWTSMPELFAKLAKGHDHQDRAWALDVVTGNQALALDDLDKARDTDYGIEQVFLAIDRRVEHELPLLVTSNLSPGGLAERYGDAIASRLVGYCQVVRVDGVDRRLA